MSHVAKKSCDQLAASAKRAFFKLNRDRFILPVDEKLAREDIRSGRRIMRTVDGIPRPIVVNSKKSLGKALRRDLQLTGTRVGCGGFGVLA